MFISPIRRLPIRNDSKSRNHLLQGVSLKPASRIDALRKKRSVLHGIVYSKKHAARHAEPTLKVTLVVDRRLPIKTKILSQNTTQT